MTKERRRPLQMECLLSYGLVTLFPYLLIIYFVLRMLDCLLLEDTFGLYMYGFFIGLIVWNMISGDDEDDEAEDEASALFVVKSTPSGASSPFAVKDDAVAVASSGAVAKEVAVVEPLSLVPKTPTDATQTLEVRVAPRAYVVYSGEEAGLVAPKLGALLPVAYHVEANTGVVQADDEGVALLRLRPVSRVAYAEVRQETRAVGAVVSAVVAKEVAAAADDE